MTLHVSTCEELYNALTGPDSDNVLKINSKRKEKIYKAGTKFLDNKFNIGERKNLPGWFSATDIVLTKGAVNVNDEKDSRNEFAGTQMKLQTTVSKSGLFGQAMIKLDEKFAKNFEDLNEKGVISLTGRTVNKLVKTHVSDTALENAGAPIDDPIIKFRFGFDPYPAAHPLKFLAGQPKTKFYDYRTKYVDDRGKPQYRLAMVEDPETGKMVPVDKNNMYLFITKNSIIRYARFDIGSTSFSKANISYPITLNHVVLEPGPPEGFSDDLDIQDSTHVNTTTANDTIIAANTATDNSASGTTSTTTTTTTKPEQNVDVASVTQSSVTTSDAQKTTSVKTDPDVLEDILGAI